MILGHEYGPVIDAPAMLASEVDTRHGPKRAVNRSPSMITRAVAGVTPKKRPARSSGRGKAKRDSNASPGGVGSDMGPELPAPAPPQTRRRRVAPDTGVRDSAGGPGPPRRRRSPASRPG